MAALSYKNQKISVVIPAFNEALSISLVVEQLFALRHQESDVSIIDTIIVCDNASTDNTSSLAAQAGANVVFEAKQGYGAACLRAIAELPVTGTPDIVVFVDGDNSVKIEELPTLLDGIIDGNDLVVGARVKHLQQSGSLTPQQAMGNWVASTLIRFLWKQPVTDLGPFRAIRYPVLQAINMQDQRFGWTVEMQVKAIQAGYQVAEIEVSNLKRLGHSKISGTLKGTIGAGLGIFGMIYKLYKNEKKDIAVIARKN